MLYSNEELEVTKRRRCLRSVAGVTIGGRGRGGRSVFIPIPRAVNMVGGRLDGLVADTNAYGHVFIRPGSNEKIFLLLSASRGFFGDGLGYIEAPSGQVNRIFTRAHQSGETPSSGWNAVLVEAAEGDIFRIVKDGYGHPTAYYIVHDGDIRFANETTLREVLAEVKYKKSEPDEWYKL